MQLTDAHAVVGGLGGGNVPLQRPQLRIAIQDELDRGLIGRQQLLGNMRDGQTRWQVEAAGIRVQIPPDQAQQAGFAAAVLAGDANLLARNNPKLASANSTRGPRRRVTSVKFSMRRGDKRQFGRQG